MIMWFSGHATQQPVKEVNATPDGKFAKIDKITRLAIIGINIHYTMEDAVKAANLDRTKEIERLKRRIERIESIQD